MIEIEGTETVFSDAAKPLLNVCRQLEQYQPKLIKQAQDHIQKALELIDEAYCNVR